MRGLFLGKLFASCGAVVALCALVPTRSEASSERLVMPYSCSFEGPRLILKPSPAQSFTIIGDHETRPYTVCRSEQAGGCRNETLHRFSIQCSGLSVPWARVVTAAKMPNTLRSWIERGRLNLVREVPTVRAGVRGCSESDAGTSAAGLSRLPPECLPWRPSEATERVVLPAGFAPVELLDARFMFGDPGREVTVAGTETGSIRKPDRSIATEALPDVGAASNGEDRWVTVIEARDLSDANAAFDSWSVPGAWALLAAMLVSLGVAAVRLRLLPDEAPARGGATLREQIEAFRVRYASRHRDGGSDTAEDVPPADGDAEHVFSLLEQAESAVASIKVAVPLRDVLEHEIATLRQRVMAARASVLEATSSPALVKVQMRTIVRDLDKVRRIAQSAARSLATTALSTDVPQTKIEAYDVLGVNADVNDGVLKKIVDALRMTWHPDLAKDELDRQAREGRIKQINVAWELLTEKRQTA